MKKPILIAVSILFVLVYAACNNQEKKENATEQTTNGGTKYACPMHPEVTSDKPGQCTKCGMDLEKVEGKTDYSEHSDSTGHENHDH